MAPLYHHFEQQLRVWLRRGCPAHIQHNSVCFFCPVSGQTKLLGGQFRTKVVRVKKCVFFVRNGDYDSYMLKFEHKRYLMEKDDIIVEIVLSAYCKAHYSCVDSCNFLEIISDLTLIRGNKKIFCFGTWKSKLNEFPMYFHQTKIFLFVELNKG